jgi:hypothetical protein
MQGDRLRIGAGTACCGPQVMVDELVVATGFRPDLSFLREVHHPWDGGPHRFTMYFATLD